MTQSAAAPASVRSALDRVALVADPGSFEPWDDDVVSDDPLDFTDSRPYRERLADAEQRVGSREAVLCGHATLGGRPLVVVAGEFGFLGGSIGVATGERVTRALERARERRVPVVALVASGGTRMQEGSLALLQMAKIAAAARRLRDDGLPYVVYFTHPTTGGVLAGWGSLGIVTFAMPAALIGFGGPRVVELMTGSRLPEGIQVAEHLYARGLVDDLVAPAELRERVERVLSVASPGELEAAVATEPPDDPGAERLERDARASLGHVRDPARPEARELLAACATDVTELRGDHAGGGDDPSCLLALARLRGIPAVVVAQSRERDRHGPAKMGPSGYRKARRGMALANELGLPLVTVIDTAGAEMSVAAEEGGLSSEIARCLSDLSVVRTPTLAVLLGEGGSGGAVALVPADRVICAEHACLQPIAPEGASAILYRTTERASEMAETQGIASWELERFGIVDRIVPEQPSAEREPEAFLERLGAAIEVELRELVERDAAERLAARARRYRAVGNPTD